MNSYKTAGIVLKGTNFGEADKILTIFTERFGKVKVIAKGIRKIKSHMAGALEPFILSNLQLHEGKTFYIVTGAEIAEDYPLLHTDLARTARAFLIGELVDNFAPEKQKLSDIFELLILSLRDLERGDRTILRRVFETKLIEAAGFKPELYDCLHCRKKIVASDNYWDREEGGVICAECQGRLHHGHAISDEAIKTLRFFETNDSATIERLKVDEKLSDELEKVLSEYIRVVLEKELKSEKFLKMLS